MCHCIVASFPRRLVTEEIKGKTTEPKSSVSSGCNGGYSFKMAAEKKMATRTFGGTLQIRVRARSDTKVTASNVNDFLLLVEAAS